MTRAKVTVGWRYPTAVCGTAGSLLLLWVIFIIAGRNRKVCGLKMEQVAALGASQRFLPLRHPSVPDRARNSIGYGCKPQCFGRSKVSNLFFLKIRSPRVTLSSVVTSAAADDSEGPLEDSPVVPTVATKFILEKQCKFGESFSVVGEDPLLGAWDLSSALPMEWSEGHIWSCQTELPVGKQYEYKFVMISTKAEPAWQPGPNRKFETSSSSSPIIVTESWEASGAEGGSEESQVKTEEPGAAEVSALTEGAAEEKQDSESSAVAAEDVTRQQEKQPVTDSSNEDVEATGNASSKTVHVTEDSSGLKRFAFDSSPDAHHATAKAAKDGDSRTESVSESEDNGGTAGPELPVPETSLASSVFGGKETSEE